jgi:hypothetical protein
MGEKCVMCGIDVAVGPHHQENWTGDIGHEIYLHQECRDERMKPVNRSDIHVKSWLKRANGSVLVDGDGQAFLPK